jgi:hypothetical protein
VWSEDGQEGAESFVRLLGKSELLGELVGALVRLGGVAGGARGGHVAERFDFGLELRDPLDRRAVLVQGVGEPPLEVIPRCVAVCGPVVRKRRSVSIRSTNWRSLRIE